MMKRRLLGFCTVLVFGTFAGLSGALAAPQDDTSQVGELVLEETVELQMSLDEPSGLLGDDYQHDVDPIVDPIGNPHVMPLATYQDCVNTCKAGIVAIEAMCRFIPDPRVKAACWLARFSTPACIGFCGLYFDK